jgi:hypothetical protein
MVMFSSARCWMKESWLAWGKADGRRKRASMTPKTMTLAATPKARVRMAVAAKPGPRRSWRRA